MIYIMENIIKKFYITTYGCQMNIHESEKIAGLLGKNGYISAKNIADADVVVFNTCCIRENAEDRADGNIGSLKKLKKQNKNLIIAVGGCMTQQSGYAQKIIKKFPFIDIVFGTHNLDNFIELLNKKLSSKKRVVEVWEKEGKVVESTPKLRSSFPNAWVNITYGCNNFCTYCIVPYVRGRERSRAMIDIVNECKELIENGYKEITLLGQNVNSYGHDIGCDFKSLLIEIDKLDGDFRLRFMTNHPKDFNEDLIKVIASCKKVCPSVHLPLQAGSDNILKLMNRRYTSNDYLQKIETLRKYIKDVAITTDIMVGFPTETDKDFMDTYSIMEKVKFAGAFTFIYSKREGTPAATMQGQIPEEVSKQRIMKLIELQNSINKTQSENYLGKTVEILCEGFDDKKQCYLGRDVYGRMAYFKGNSSLLGKFVSVKITKTGGISLLGEVVDFKN